MDETQLNGKRRPVRTGILVGMTSFLVGVLATALGAYAVMPQKMIVTRECKMGVDETVAALKESIVEHGWVVSSVGNMNKSLEKQGVDFGPKVRTVRLCHPLYAESVLTTDRYIASMMPCNIAVWEGDDGKTYMSQMNMGLMAKMFGGNIAKVMGGAVASEEHSITEDLVLE